MKKLLNIIVILLSIIVFSQHTQDKISVKSYLTKALKEQEQNQYDEAYRTLLEALKFAEENGDKAQVFYVETSIANLFLLKNETAQAKKFFNHKVPEKSFPQEVQSFYYHRKAFYYNHINKKDSALMMIDKALEIALENNFTNDISLLYNEMAFIYEHENKFKLAEEFYNKALSSSDHNLVNKSNIKLNIARLYAKMKLYDESNYLLENVLNEIDTTDLHHTKVHLFGSFSSNYLQLGDSLNYYKYSFLNRDAALTAQKEYSETQYRELQLKYQSKEKDELISKKNDEQKELLILIFGILFLLILVGIFSFYTKNKNKKLKKLLNNNHFLLKELNHRTKNNLQLIISLVTREIRKNKNDEISGLNNLSSQIGSIATLHQQLYLNDKLEAIELKVYIEEILVNLNPFISYKKIEISNEVDQVEVDVNQSLYIGLLINELVTNSIKHAFGNQLDRKIEISIKNKNSYLEINYSDNGIGVKEGSKVKLIITLSKQLDAKYTIENKSGFSYYAEIKI